VDQFKRHEEDCGSTEYQIARLSARVVQLTKHLSQHKKDFATRRGLLQILGQRKQLLAYLQRENK
jgi:small subunit ribosomal protein S15